ncbi:MAG: ribosome-associated translation inhibitor RaiA [Bacteriovoracaceae bacterium]|jgi:ribosome-associated translation inhibitor RaiA
MKIVRGEEAPQVKQRSKEILNSLLKKYPEARGFKFSLTEDTHSYFTTTLEVRVGKKRLIAKKIGASANESIGRAFSALKKRLEKNLHRKKFFLSIPTSYAV